MASTNKTANLHLNQWAASDPVLREDFNADNAALDAAFGNLLFTKIREVTTTQNAQVVEFDLSDLNPDDWEELQIHMLLKKGGAVTYDMASIFFNSVENVNSTLVCHLSYGSNSFNGPHGAIYGYTSRLENDPPSVWSIRLQPSLKNAENYRIYQGQWQCAYKGDSVALAGGFFTLYTDALNKLIIKKEQAAGTQSVVTVAAGSTIRIYGVKK